MHVYVRLYLCTQRTCVYVCMCVCLALMRWLLFSFILLFVPRGCRWRFLLLCVCVSYSISVGTTNRKSFSSHCSVFEKFFISHSSMFMYMRMYYVHTFACTCMYMCMQKHRCAYVFVQIQSVRVYIHK